jgi:hypothetical protein
VLSLDFIRAREDDCSNAQSNLENRNSQAVLRSRGGVGIVGLAPFNPLSATVHSQLPENSRGSGHNLAEILLVKTSFRTGVPVLVTQTFLKRDQMKDGD